MKKSLFILILINLCVFFNTNGQESKPGYKKTTLQIAENIMNNTSFRIINVITGESIDPNTCTDFKDVRVENPYCHWVYTNGLIHIAFNKLSEMLNDDTYREVTESRYAFAFREAEPFRKNLKGQNKWNYPFGQFLTTEVLDDCGAMSAGLLDIYPYYKKDEYHNYLMKVADFMLNDNMRLPDGTYCRKSPKNKTIWADDLYMSVPFLARMGKFTGDNKYFDEAILQVENFSKYLMNPTTNVYYHCWYSEFDMNGVACWGRCNGWVMMAQAELLSYLPEDHPKRDELIQLLLKQIVGISRYQSPQGMWYQLVDKPDSYLEASATAMFIYSIAKAVNEKWIDRSYLSIAENGWKGLQEITDQDGNVSNICVGTSVEDNLAYYYNRKGEVNDTHGIGSILLAGIELMRTVKEE